MRTTRYEVSCLPEDAESSWVWTITVEYRGRGLWAVSNGLGVLSTAGEWNYEPSSTNRTDDWIAAHRFDLDTALAKAKEIAPLVKVRDITVTDALRHYAEGRRA